ncbi:hypothetical protein JHK86_019641 [Glycine max]|uniref:Uncharacterized protein n=1 Tax=Glycine max TaxID=3847 RepID=K7L3G1_SOYBN|nr:hypothetical protein JHK86_019641 [Glycine max]
MLKYPRLYPISCQQQQLIQQMGRFTVAGWEWNFKWRRPLFDNEIDMAARFLGDIEHPSGEYSVGSAYNLLLGESIDENQDGVFKELWNLKIPSKASLPVLVMA